MKVVFMGTPDFAVPVLEALCENHEVTAVVTQPDKPKGRGKKMLFPPVKEKALEKGIKVYQPEKIRDAEFVEMLKSMESDIFVVAAYGQILSQEVLDIPKYGCINVHASLLPKYRGAAPIQQCIIDGEKKTGITIMYMERSLDTGDMILKEECGIDDNETYESLHDKLAPIGARALIKAMELIEKGEVHAEKQDDSLSCYAHMIKRETGHINWSKSCEEIRNLIRGLNPVPAAYTIYNDENIKIFCAEKISDEKKDNAGEIISADKKKGFCVSCGDGILMITEVQGKGGKRMSAADYMRGHEIKLNTILL
ncbi:MAG: methionyl-tRNA formyltransferase [Firmicutes bacterium]|nr:methionyl-tRNA formyltransferase [Bacillota bacterium]